jgi:hypothetical protein
MQIPPQPQVLIWLFDGTNTWPCLGQLVHDRDGTPFVIPNYPIQNHPRIKLDSTLLQQQDNRTLGLVWYIHNGKISLTP